jgi:hypothetical protein
VTKSLVAMQLKDVLLRIEAATISAWRASARGEYRPGTMNHGVTLPSSQVIDWASRGGPCRSRPPQTIASKALAPPVRCT